VRRKNPLNPFATTKKSSLGKEDVSAGADTPFNPFAPKRNKKKDAAGSGSAVLKKKTAKTRKSFPNMKELVVFLQKQNNQQSSSSPSSPALSADTVEWTCRQIVEFMEAEPNVSSVQRDGARALHLLSLLDETDYEDEASLTCAGVEAILTAMENFPHDEALQKLACVAMEALTAWEENQAVILSKEYRIDDICVVMDRFSDNMALQVSALGIFHRLSWHPDAVDGDVAKRLANAIPFVVGLLKEHRDNVEIYNMGCSTLAKLTEDNPDSQLRLCEKPDQVGIRVAIDALHNGKFEDHPEIERAAMLILQHVASNPSLECKANIIRHGGMDCILDVLEEHSSIVATESSSNTTNSKAYSEGKLIMASALQTLANLSDSKLPDHDVIKQKMSVSVPIMLDVLQQHPNIAQVQLTGYSALKNLAHTHARLLTTQDFEGILKSMKAQMNNAAVQKQACRTLVNFLSKSNGNANKTNNLLSGGNSPSAKESLDLVRAIANVDGLSIIFRSIRAHQHHRAVQEAAFGVLYFFSCSQDLTTNQKHQLCLEENVFVLLGTMNSYIESEILCERGCGLILNMSFFAPFSLEGMASAGGTRIMLAAMRRHGLNAKVQEYGAGILSGLCLDPQIHAEFVNEEGVSTVVAAMMVHPYQPGVQAFGCDVLASVASSDASYKQVIADSNTQMIAKDAMTRHKKHKGVQNRASAVLRAIS